MNIENIGLVLEGGGMRGSYTCGVLEFFLQKELDFKYIVGVSAGACNAMSYLSKQKGRNETISIGYVRDKRYLSVKNLIKEGSLFGMNFIFDEIPNKYVPFDYETFEKYDGRFLVGTTDCNTGKSIFFEKEDITRRCEVVRASASLPLVSNIVNYKGYELLDGGLSDSIPIKKALLDGYDKNIIVLTRNKEYRKSPSKINRLISMKYKKYPKLIDAVKNRYKVYNETLDYIEELEREGKVFVLRPSKTIEVGRFERNPNKLQDIFDLGYSDINERYEEFMKFIK